MQIETLVLTKPEIKETPNIYITSEAYAKLLALYNMPEAKTYEFMYIGEVENNKNNYIIKNIRIMPQCNISGAHCETDDDKYPIWLQENYSIQDRKLIRFHGHSHVNMGTSPSGDDNNAIMKMMNYVQDYFIQFIRNLRGDYTLNLYNKKQLLIYKNLELKLILENNIVIDLKSNKILTELSKKDMKDLKIANEYLRINTCWKLNFKTLEMSIEDKYVRVTNNNKLEILDIDKIIKAQEKDKEMIPFPKYNSVTNYSYYDHYKGSYNWNKNIPNLTEPDVCKSCQLKGEPYCIQHCFCSDCEEVFLDKNMCKKCEFNPNKLIKEEKENEPK